MVGPRLASSAAIETKDGFHKVIELRESLPQQKAKTFRLPITDAKKTLMMLKWAVKEMEHAGAAEH